MSKALFVGSAASSFLFGADNHLCVGLAGRSFLLGGDCPLFGVSEAVERVIQQADAVVLVALSLSQSCDALRKAGGDSSARALGLPSLN